MTDAPFSPDTTGHMRRCSLCRLPRHNISTCPNKSGKTPGDVRREQSESRIKASRKQASSKTPQPNKGELDKLSKIHEEVSKTSAEISKLSRMWPNTKTQDINLRFTKVTTMLENIRDMSSDLVHLTPNKSIMKTLPRSKSTPVIPGKKGGTKRRTKRRTRRRI